MKKLFYLAAVAAMAVGMTSCSSEEEIANGNQVANLDINVSIAGDASSRAITSEKSAFVENDQIGITILTQSGLSATTDKTYGTGRENIAYTKANDGKWTGTIALNNTTGYVYAYSPYLSTINLASQAIDNTKDWMYGVGAAGVSSSSSSTSIAMKHALAKIKVTIAKSSYTGTGSLTALSITSDGIYSKGTLNTLNGTVTMGTSDGVKEFSWSGSYALTTSQADVDSWMVVPIGGSTAKDIVITATVDAQNYSATISGITPTKGYFYTIPLTLSDQGLSFGADDITITDWTSSPSSDTPLTPVTP